MIESSPCQSVNARDKWNFQLFFLSCICSFICWFLLLFIVGFGKEQSNQLLSASDMIQYKVIWLLFFILISFHLFVATLSSFISVPSLALRLSPPDRYDYAFICIKSECIRKVSLLIGQWAIKSHIICFLVCFFFSFQTYESLLFASLA